MSQERVSSMDEKKIRSDREQYRTDQEQYREDPAAERKTEDMIREMAEEIEIPHSVTPEAVEEALEKRSREQRRSRFRKSGWKYLAAAACLCLAVGIPLDVFERPGSLVVLVHQPRFPRQPVQPFFFILQDAFADVLHLGDRLAHFPRHEDVVFAREEKILSGRVDIIFMDE